MKKKIAIIGIILILALTVIGLCTYSYFNKKEDNYTGKKLFSIEQYKKIKVDDIESITITKYTEGGDNSENISNTNEISKIYNKLSNITLGAETDMTCQDNTISYSFNLKNHNSVYLEIECDWVIINNKRYLIK